MGVQDVYHETEKSFANGTNDREAHPKRWIAVLVQMNCEKKTATQLGKAGYETYIPTQQEIHQWSDRKKKVNRLIMPMVVFVRATVNEEEWLRNQSYIFRLLALPGSDEDKRKAKLLDMESRIAAYEAVVKTGNEILDTVLTEKKLTCQINHIAFSCIADGAQLSFMDELDIYGKAVCYDGMYQIAKRKGEWKTATENMDAYKILYDSMQIMTDNEELNRLMDKHQLEEHKRLLSEHTRTLIFSLITAFSSLMIICVFCFMWNDRKRKKHYIALQHELTQKRVDTMLLKEEELSESNKEHIDKKRSELTEQQIQLCISVLKTTDCYDQLEALERATPKQLLVMRSLRKEIRSDISNAFVDVMMNLKERYPALTGDDVFFCVLSLLCCSKTVVMELMDATSDALKTRKNRIKNKMDAQIFERVFGVDNQ